MSIEKIPFQQYFKEKEKILQEYIIPDISNLIMGYINIKLNSFKEIDIDECVEYGNYLYYTENETLLHYIFRTFGQAKRRVVENLLDKSTYLKANNFQNIGEDKETELHWICYMEMESIILLINDLKPSHFQNKDKHNVTELYWLCKYNLGNAILSIKNWKIKHFQNKNNMGRTELYWLCKNKMHNNIIQING